MTELTPERDGGCGQAAHPARWPSARHEEAEASVAPLWRKFRQARAQPLRDRLVLHYAPLVKYVAGRLGAGMPAHVDVADLVQSGVFGLVDAIEKFEPERGHRFEVYAMQRIRGAILDELRAQDWVPRSVRGRGRDIERALEALGAQLQRAPTDGELADELGIELSELKRTYDRLRMTSVLALDELITPERGSASLAETLRDHEAADPVTALLDRDTRRQLANAVAALAEKERTVVALYYFENRTLAEIGRALGLSESRACQLHTRAVLRLRGRMLAGVD
jgi:RNA polymerase sigma factor for flagellar operon FliA